MGPLARVHRPTNKGTVMDTTHMVLSPQWPQGPFRVAIKGEWISARECRAFAAWLMVAADWIEAHENTNRDVLEAGV